MNIFNHVINNMMMDLDNYLTQDIKDIYNSMDFFPHSYIYKDDYDRGWRHVAFRHPGATRGHIVIDENDIITDIVFYDDTCYIYCGNYIEDIKQKYIGTKLSLEEVCKCED